MNESGVTMKKAVIYARYSSALQNEQSIEGQIHTVEKFAEENDYQVIEKYIDRAISGTSDNRPAFQQMISASSGRNFEAVLVYKLDRFARNRYDSAIYKKKLRENGVKVISATENISDTAEGVMMEAFVEAMDEYYSAELGRKMKRGKEESLRKGRCIAKRPPFGYKKINHRFVIDEEKAVIAQEIFEKFASGQTMKEIVDSLNQRGYVNGVGKKWNTGNIHAILKSEVYTGKYTVGTLTVQGTAPRLISSELFEQVQNRRENFMKTHRKTYNNFKFYLSGKLYCNCGGTMSGFSVEHGKHHYYRCTKKCGQKNQKAEILHQKVYDALCKYLTEEKIEKLANIAFCEYEKNSVTSSEINAVVKEISEIDKRLENATEAILSGLKSETIACTITELESRKHKLQTTLKELQKADVDLSKSDFINILKSIIKKAALGNQEQLIDAVVSSVYVLPDNKIAVSVNISDSKNDNKDLLSLPLIPISQNLSKKIVYLHGKLYIFYI